MIPSGMLTIPEALELIRARIDDDDMRMQREPKPDRREVACASLAEAILGTNVTACIVSGGALHRVRNDFDWTESRNIENVAALMDGWESWLVSGRVKNASKYNGATIFVSPSDLRLWLGPEPQITKARTGTQGRPTKSWPVIEQEFNRRRGEGKTASSREGEAKALVAWLKDTHPTAERPTAKTIQNNLPADFQPRAGNGHPK
jgi:hypothetical protein